MNIFKNRTVLGVMCIVLSLVVCFGITPLMNNAVSEKTTIVRVKSEISTGELISASKLETVEVGGYNLPSNVIRDENTIIGSYALADMYKGDYVLNNKISQTKQSENAYLYNLDGTKQAISVTIQDLANGLSGKLESGDVISIISANYKGFGETVIPPELKYVEVITVTADSGADANTSQEYYDNTEERELPKTITLLVTPEQSKVLAELESSGEIHVSLVYRGSEENSAEFIKVQDDILTQIYFPELLEETTEEGTEQTSEVE